MFANSSQAFASNWSALQRRLELRERGIEFMAELQDARAQDEYGRRRRIHRPPLSQRCLRVAVRARVGKGLAEFDVTACVGQCVGERGAGRRNTLAAELA